MAAHPVAPDLISDFPILHCERRRVTVSGTHRTIFRRFWSVAVFNPCGGFCGGGAASLDVDRYRRLSTDGTCKHHELIGAEVARLGFVLPRKIGPRHTLVTRSYSPHPVIILGHVSPWPAYKRGLQ